MGWSSDICPRPRSRAEMKQLLYEHFANETWEWPTTILKHNIVKGVWYALFETTKPDGNTYKWIGVCLFRWEKGELWTKFMDTTVGPCYYDCPVSWLKGVSFTSEFEIHWRDCCLTRQKEAARKSALIRNLKAGDRVLFKATYAGCNEWVYTGEPWYFRKPDGSCYTRLRNWRKHLLEVTDGNEAQAEKHEEQAS